MVVFMLLSFPFIVFVFCAIFAIAFFVFITALSIERASAGVMGLLFVVAAAAALFRLVLAASGFPILAWFMAAFANCWTFGAFEGPLVNCIFYYEVKILIVWV